jgi:hypothetical protein
VKRLVPAVLLLFACADPTGPRSDLLAAARRGASVELRNLTDDPVHYVVVEREYSASAMLALCTDPAVCPRVPPRGSLSVPFTEIAGYSPGAREATVLHWRLVPDPADGFAIDSVRALVTGLR